MEKAKSYQSVMWRLTVVPHVRWLRWTLASLLIGLLACSAEPPEQALRKQLQHLHTALEQGQVDDAMAQVAQDFSGPRGMNRAALHNMLRMQVLAQRRIGVTTSAYQIRLQQDTATVQFDALMTGAERGRWLPDQAQSYAVTLGWRQQEDQWQLYYADWQANR